mgnify:CR=1 FL=1
MMNRNIEIEAAEALLDIGVSLPFICFRVPFTRKKICLFRLTMKRPRLGNLLEYCRSYLKLGYSYKEVAEFDKHEQFHFMALHGKEVANMLSLIICRNGFFRPFSGLLKWFVIWAVPMEYSFAAHVSFMEMLGTSPFSPIIRSAEKLNPMTPHLSHKTKGS